MCQFKSAIILKDRIYIPDIDSHTEMLKQLKIEDNFINAQKTFVRVELIPKEEDPFSNIENWTFKIDQDVTPDWFNVIVDKSRMIEAVKEWAKNRIYIGADNLELYNGANYILKDCTNVVLMNNVNIHKIYGNSNINAMYDNSKIENLYDNSKINEMYGNSKIETMYNNSKVNYMYNNSKINSMYNNSKINSMYNNSKIGYMCNNSKINYMYNNSKVDIMYDNSKIDKMYGNSIINIYDKNINANTIILYNRSIIRNFYTNTIYISKFWNIETK